MNDIKKIPIIRAITLMATESISHEEAARRSGISRSTLENALKENPELLEETVSTVLAQVKAPLRELYEDAMRARVTLMTGFIQDAKNPDLPLADRLKIDNHLKTEISNLEKDMALISTEEENDFPPLLPISSEPGEAEKFLAQLSPPKLKRGRAIISIKETTATIDLNEEEQPDFIDGETS